MSTNIQTRPPRWHLYVPKLITVLREGYGPGDFRNDIIAGLTVAIVALPLAMALAIASGTTPDKGLTTAIIAGFLISLLGGSRVQIGGPTGAFVVVVFGVIAKFGYDGLIVATLMASVMLILAGLAGLGVIIKYVPQPVVTGFTSGIAVIIFSSQVGEFLGLHFGKVPAEFIEKWEAYIQNLHTLDPATLTVSGVSLAIILLARKFAPKLPGFLMAVVAGALIVWLAGLQIDTIGSRFGGIPSSLPAPAWPDFTLNRLRELLPSAFTIAFLAGIESLLSAVVADAATRGHHRSNCELVAQGVANGVSALFGGLPATGAIARTMTNIRSGARSPVAGILHAVFLLVFMFVAAPLASYVPLASLSAVLVIVAWNMSEVERFRHLLKAPRGDRVTLVLTFLLTVMVDLTFAIEIGVILAAILFMLRMEQAVEIQSHGTLIQPETDDFAPHAKRALPHVPEGVESLQISGPFFFGVTNKLMDFLDTIASHPKVFVLDLTQVPVMDASGAHALGEFVARARHYHAPVILAGLRYQPRKVISKMGFVEHGEHVEFARDYAEALARAAEVVKA